MSKQLDEDYNKKYNLIIKCYDEKASLIDAVGSALACKLAEDSCNEIRSIVAKALVWASENEGSARLLHKLAQDEDLLVRLEAIDSLSAYSDKESMTILQNALDDPDELIRMYSAIGFSRICQRIAEIEYGTRILQHYLNIEKCDIVKIALFEGLYVLGDFSKLENIINMFECEDYHIKCFIINSLIEIINYKNYNDIIQFIDRVNLMEVEPAVSSSIACLRKVANRYCN